MYQKQCEGFYFLSDSVACLFVHVCAVDYTVYIVTSRRTAASLCWGRQPRGLQLSFLAQRAPVYEEKKPEALI